jgi:DNA segregation ATPase FtsK/SpoIIIE, S-DNA-T family
VICVAAYHGVIVHGGYSTPGGNFVEFQVSVADLRDPGNPAEVDCVVSAGPEHRVADLIAALCGLPGPGARAGAFAFDGRDTRTRGDAGRPQLWLGADRLPEDLLLTASGISAGAQLGLGGPPPAAGRADRSRPWTGGPDRAAAPRLAELRVVSGPDAGLTVPLPPGEHLIGRQGPLQLSNTGVSRKHSLLTVAADGATFTLRDLDSQNGTGLDGKAIGPDPVPVRAGQLIHVGKDVLTVAAAGTGSTISLRSDPANPFGLLVNRQMRTPPGLPEPVVIDLGGRPQARSRSTWLTMLIGPAVSVASGVALGAITRQWLFLLVGLGGTVATVVPQLVNRRTSAGSAKAGLRQLAQAAAAGQERLAETVTAEEQARRAALPDPATLGRIAAEPGPRLWERTPADEDFLRIRFGTGDLPASTVSVRGGEPGTAPRTHDEPERPVLRDVPVAADLAALGVLGIAGPVQASLPALAWAVAQLAVLHAPGDLRLVLLTGNPRAWEWTRWLPQLRPLGDQDAWLSVGTDPATRAKRVAELCELIDSRRAAGGLSGGYGIRGFDGGRRDGVRRDQLPCVVVIVDGSAGVRDIPGIDQVLCEGPSAGVSVICRDDDPRELPAVCGGRLDTDPAASGAAIFTVRDSGATTAVSRLDVVNVPWADGVARALAPLSDRSSGREMGTGGTVRLDGLWGFDHMSASTVTDLWRRTGGQRTAVPVGRLVDGSPLVLDIATQGPNMLVGGSPGSGKSEFLQTLVASLALGNTPDALTFVLIDYKGGTAFQGCLDLPHVTGFLSDLDEHLGSRVLVALRAEIKYRERLFHEARCKDIETYRAAGEPLGRLPRLVVIADEFAELARELPGVLEQMTAVTRLGRAYGVHLVLATQRPAGVVNADMTSNTSLRVSLRVEEAQDSTSVIGIPAAASIAKRDRGRGYARFEQGTVSQFQSAYVGAPARGGLAATALLAAARPFATLGTSSADESLPLPGTREAYAGPTDLSELVEAVQATRQRPPGHRAWLEPLPQQIPFTALPAAVPGHAAMLASVAYGMADLPASQRQEPLALDLASGSNLVVGGAAQSGRTTALRTIAAGIAAGCSPADVHLYVLDCDSGTLGQLERLPHCGAVVRHTDPQRAARLLDRLDVEVARRQDLLAADGYASVTEQRAKVPAAARLPYLVLLLDQWETFSEELGQLDNQRLTATLNRLLSQGPSMGLRVIVTGGLAALNKLRECPARIVLRMSGPTDLYSAGVPKGAMPANPPQGRGLLLGPHATGPTEVQIAYVGTDPSGTAQTTALNDLIGAARSAYPAPSPAPLRVDSLPSRLTLARAVSTVPGWTGRSPLRPAIAVGGDDLGWLGPDLTQRPGFAIAGPFKSGKSTALVVLAESLLAAGTSVVGLAPLDSPLRDLDGRDGVRYLFTDEKPDPVKLLEVLRGAAGPMVVLADDADTFAGQQAIEEMLTAVPVKGRDRGGWGLVVVSSAAQLGRPTRNLLTTVRERYRSGLLLWPEDTQQPTLFGARLPRSAVFDRPAGRGYLIEAGRAVLVQVPGAGAN